MNSTESTSLKKVSFDAFDFTNIRDSLQEGKRSLRRNVKGIWNKRLELFFGFIPALLVFVITYSKRFR